MHWAQTERLARQVRQHASFSRAPGARPGGCSDLPMGVPPHVENLALVIDGTPQMHLLTGQAHHHLVPAERVQAP